jgi:hypothetical protein
MIIISHRANLKGKDKNTENHPDQIRKVSRDFLVEVDIWYSNGWYFGHDNPQYKVDLQTFEDIKDRVIYHAKNNQAAERLLETDLHWFWHQKDDMTITSKGWLWCYPDKPLRGGILVDFNSPRYIDGVSGVCVNDPIRWSNLK